MCRAMEEMRAEAAREATRIAEQKAKEAAKAAEQKAKKEKLENIINSIKNLTETLGLTAEKAMDALRIPESDRETYRSILEAK